jgi:hypothetical protein
MLQQTVLAQVQSGRDPHQKRQKYKRVNKALESLCQKVDDIPLMDYLRGCAHNVEMNV